MIIKEPHIANGQTLIWETTRLIEKYDITNNTYHKGVNISALKDKLAYYEGAYIAIRKLTAPKHYREHFSTVINSLFKKYNGKAYDNNLLHMYVSLHGSFFGPPKNKEKKAYFCSELIALSYMEIGLLPKNGKPAIYYEPQDFSCASNMKLPEGCTLGLPIFIVLPHTKRIVQNQATRIQ